MEQQAKSKKIKKVKQNLELEKGCEVEKYKNLVKKEAEELVVMKFPERILKLQSLLDSDKFNYHDLTQANSDINIPIPVAPQISASFCEDVFADNESIQSQTSTQSKAVLFPNGVVPCNHHLLEMVDTLKPITLQLIKDANSVKMGIMLMIPKIEDGNNFGVEIQEETLCGVALAEADAQKRLDQFSTYFAQRAKLVTKVAKYPHCDDYRRAVLENDEKFRLILCLMIVDLRNHYIQLHDMFTKNLNKIKSPRSGDNQQMMY